MERFDFSIGPCEVIHVMCFPQVPSKQEPFPVTPHPVPIWTATTPPFSL